MVACDSPNCKIEWYHFPCIGLTKKPDSNVANLWYCPECYAKI